jgi:protein-S-isoprenylcysteine O-methyltransferase Ste14
LDAGEATIRREQSTPRDFAGTLAEPATKGSPMYTPRLSQTADLIGRMALVGLFSVLATQQTVALVALFGHPGEADVLDIAARVASIAYVALVVGLTVIRLKPLRNAEGWEPRFSALVGTFLSIALVALPQPDIGTALRVTSLVLIGVGWVLSAVVLLWLGRAFSVMPQARRLVTTGPYAIVRHPLYLCEEITVIGIALAHLSIAAVLIVAVQWMFQLRRMSNEEKVLGASFPECAAYAAKTPKIIPALFSRYA